MGDRANVLVREYSEDNGVYLYTHWNGSELPFALQEALAKEWRWDDAAYLTRIIFDVMTKKHHNEETGYGISTYICDGRDRVLIVNSTAKTVSRNEKSWTFKEYIALSKDELLMQLKW